jgi:hypothetical protein
MGVHRDRYGIPQRTPARSPFRGFSIRARSPTVRCVQAGRRLPACTAGGGVRGRWTICWRDYRMIARGAMIHAGTVALAFRTFRRGHLTSHPFLFRLASSRTEGRSPFMDNKNDDGDLRSRCLVRLGPVSPAIDMGQGQTTYAPASRSRPISARRNLLRRTTKIRTMQANRSLPATA